MRCIAAIRLLIVVSALPALSGGPARTREIPIEVSDGVTADLIAFVSEQRSGKLYCRMETLAGGADPRHRVLRVGERADRVRMVLVSRGCASSKLEWRDANPPAPALHYECTPVRRVAIPVAVHDEAGRPVTGVHYWASLSVWPMPGDACPGHVTARSIELASGRLDDQGRFSLPMDVYPPDDRMWGGQLWITISSSQGEMPDYETAGYERWAGDLEGRVLHVEAIRRSEMNWAGDASTTALFAGITTECANTGCQLVVERHRVLHEPGSPAERQGDSRLAYIFETGEPEQFSVTAGDYETWLAVGGMQAGGPRKVKSLGRFTIPPGSRVTLHPDASTGIRVKSVPLASPVPASTPAPQHSPGS